MRNIFSKNKKITNRQVECLKILTNIYSERNEPVHYTEIAPLLKVSKWSTYDMLKTLERKRLVRPVYKELDGIKLSKKGRRAVFFVPSTESFIEKELDSVRNKRHKIKNFSFNFNKFPKISPEVYCIGFLVALGTICLESFQSIIPVLQSYFASLSSDPKSALLFIVYTLVGAVIGNLKTPEAKKIIEANLDQYKSYIEKMSKESLREIFDTTVSLIESQK